MEGDSPRAFSDKILNEMARIDLTELQDAILDFLDGADESTTLLVEMLASLRGVECSLGTVRDALTDMESRGLVTSYRARYAGRGRSFEDDWWQIVDRARARSLMDP